MQNTPSTKRTFASLSALRLWWLALSLGAGMMSGLASAHTFQGPGIYSGLPGSGQWAPIGYLTGEASATPWIPQWKNANSGQRYEITSVGAGGAYFQIKNLDWSTAGKACLGNAAGSLQWVACPTAAAPNTAAQLNIFGVTYTGLIAPAWAKIANATTFMTFVNTGACLTQSVAANTPAAMIACDLLASAGTVTSGMWSGGGSGGIPTLTTLPHLLLTQPNSSSVPNDNTTRTVTITSCKNAVVGTCDPITSDNQPVTVSIVSGTGTLSSTSVQMSAGVGSFTVKSLTANTVQLKVVPANLSYPGATGTCNRNGALTGESGWTAANAECAVVFGAAMPDHIQLSQADTTTRMADGTSTKTITVSSCSNALGSACTLMATDTQTVSLINTGVGTLNVASVTLVGGQATFTVLSSSPGEAKLDVTATATNGYSCTRAGTSGAQTAGAAGNIDCQVSFLPPHHIQLSQADSSPIPFDNTATKTVTVTSCANAAVGTCTTLVGDTQTVTIANLGVGTLIDTPVTLVAGVGTFTVKSGVVGNAQLKVTGSTATGGYSCTRGTPPATAGTDTNVDCQVTFGVGGILDALEPSPATYPLAMGVSRLFTRVAGNTFNFDVAAITTATSTINTGFTGTVDVELMKNYAGSCGAFGDSDQLQAVGSHAYVAGNNGRYTFSTSYPDPVRNIRVRIRSSGQVYCSTDSFDIRPTYYELAATPDSSNTVVAGAAFSITATLKNAAGTTIIGIAGAPTLNLAGVTDWTTTAIPAGSLSGGFAAMSNGVATGNLFKYTDIGPLSFTSYLTGSSGVTDTTFMDGTSDKTAGDCITGSNLNTPDSNNRIGCDIGSAALTTPRFKPHHYEVTTGFTPACVSGLFTYMGQPLGITSNIKVMNAGGTVMTRVLSGPAVPTGWTMPSVASVIALDNTAANLNSSLTGFPAAPSWPSYAALGGAPPAGGVATISGNYTTDRPVVTAPAHPPNYDTFRLNSTISDPDGQTITVCTDGAATSGSIINANATCSSPTTKVRFGILKIENAYGSDMLNLPVMVRALFWNGTSWQPNDLDGCTTINPASIAIGNRKGQMTVSNFPPGNLPTVAVTLSSGKGLITIKKPNPTATGTADLAINLGPAGPAAAAASCTTSPLPMTTPADMAWLRGQWCGGLGYTQDPSTRIGFGVSKSPFLYRRERY